MRAAAATVTSGLPLETEGHAAAHLVAMAGQTNLSGSLVKLGSSWLTLAF